MEALAVIDRGWRLHGGLEGWRRVTGISRHALACVSLLAWVHPDDALALRELARGISTQLVRMGGFEARTVVELEVGEWTREGFAPIVARPVVPLEVSAWWVPAHRLAGLGAMPSTILA
ncbi:MAG: hypothetical protein MUE69_33080 [Myxococcota bacterium]|jgi:hypothetical protein|nr:hypothetical protein [Myxococcota bacterium]